MRAGADRPAVRIRRELEVERLDEKELFRASVGNSRHPDARPSERLCTKYELYGRDHYSYAAGSMNVRNVRIA